MPDIRPGMNQPKKLVYGTGPADAQIAIVGEAPGETEAREGIPFVGASGMLLNTLLSQVGLSRTGCYITNVIKEHPYRNNIKPFIDLDRKAIKESEAYTRYRQELKEELLEINPTLIIAVGNVSLYALTGKRGILKWRGSVLESTLLPGVKVLPIIHPAAALRQYVLRHFILFDLKKAPKLAKSRELPVDNRTYILRPTFEESVTFLQNLKETPRFAFDIEVSRGQLDCISFAPTADLAISIPFVEGPNEYFPLPQEREIIRLIAEVLESSESEKIGHNTTFDATFLLSRYGIKSKNLHDTMVAQAILFPDFPKGLAFVTSIYTDIPYYKDEGKEAMFQGGSSGMQFWLYNAKDSIVLMEAFPKMLKDLERQGNLDTYHHQRSLIEPLLFIGTRGLAIDGDSLRIKAAEAKVQLAEITEQINLAAGKPINASSPKQLLEFFYGDCKIKPYLKLGKPTTDEKALVKLSHHKHPKASAVASLMLKHRKLDKLRGTYYEVKISPDGRLRCSMNPVGTKTGRLSSSQTIEGYGANLQNQPKSMKKYMHPDPGCIFIELDLAQAENRVVAYISGDDAMIDAFEQGRDLHRQTAGIIFNKAYADVSDEEGSAPLSGGKSERDWGKRGNHGINYRLGARKAAGMWEVPEAEAKHVISKVHAMYPGVTRWHKKVEEQLYKNRTITNLLGRRYTFWERLDDAETINKAVAFGPQSTVADLLNRSGLVPVYKDQEAFGDVELMLQVHDSLLLQVPVDAGFDRIAEIILDIKRRLEIPLTTPEGRSFIIPAEFTIKPKNYAEGTSLVDINEHGAKVWPSRYNDPHTLAQAISNACET